MRWSVPTLAQLVNRLSPAARGRLAEKLAAIYLLLLGFTPVRRPGRAPVQTDLLVQRGHLVLVVEVKYRQTFQSTAIALSPTQIQRLKREAHRLCGYMPQATVRLDVVEVAPIWPYLRHKRAAHPLD